MNTSRPDRVYAEKLLPVSEAVARLRRDDVVATPIATGQPAAFLSALAERDDWNGLTIFGGLLVDAYPVLKHPGVRFVSGFYGPIERWLLAEGARIDYLPADFLGWERYARKVKPRVVASAVTTMSERGFLNFGLHAGATFHAFREAAADPERLAVAEGVRDMPTVFGLGRFGANAIHVSEVDVVIESDRSVFVLPPESATDEDDAIARHVEELIEEGSTLQIGIGGVPNLVATKLAESSKGDFGIHTEMMVDGVLRLHQADKVTNHKGVLDGFSVATFAAGSRDLYDWMHRNPEVRMLPVAEVNDPAIIRRNRRMVSLNGALAVDLHGQVMADTIGPKQHSGVGGHELFVTGAHDCPDGKSILCLRSTFEKDGERHSTIVAALPSGTPATTPRHHVQYVVTEQGVAALGLLTARERAEALVAIAHPDFRDELRASLR